MIRYYLRVDDIYSFPLKQAEEIVGSLWLPKYHTLRDSLKQFNMGKIPAWLGRRDKFREENGSSAKEKETVRLSIVFKYFIRFHFVSKQCV